MTKKKQEGSPPSDGQSKRKNKRKPKAQTTIDRPNTKKHNKRHKRRRKYKSFPRFDNDYDYDLTDLTEFIASGGDGAGLTLRGEFVTDKSPNELFLIPSNVLLNTASGDEGGERLMLIPTSQNELFIVPLDQDDYDDDSAEQSWTEVVKGGKTKELELCLKREEKAVREYLKEHATDFESLETRRQILLMNADVSVKAMLLKKYEQIHGKKGGGDGMSGADKTKLQSWLNDVLTLPFNKTMSLPVSVDDGPSVIKEYLATVRDKLEKAVAGHEHVKDEIIDYIARIISNPQGKGNTLALCGSKGCGKTRLIKRGVAEALGRPFHVINLGGLNDVHVLTGHDLTYSGSKYGRVAQILIQSKCDNPVIYLDEIDKIQPNSEKGMEIFRVLTHILDEEQNMEFYDEYFGGVKIDLSKILFVASLNNLEDVEPILRDRLKVIHMHKLDLAKKIEIGYLHIMPELIQLVGFDQELLEIPEETMKYIVTNKTVQEDGCRQFKKKLETIIQKLNTMYITQTALFSDPSNKVILTKDIVDDLSKHNQDSSDDYPSHMYS